MIAYEPKRALRTTAATALCIGAVFALILGSVAAQSSADVSGVWTGQLTQPQWIVTIYDFRLELKQEGDRVSGTSRTGVAGQADNFVVMNVAGTVRGNSLTLREGRVVQLRGAGPGGPGTSWCIKSFNLTLDDSNTSLTGRWTADCLPGEVRLFRGEHGRNESFLDCIKTNAQAYFSDARVLLLHLLPLMLFGPAKKSFWQGLLRLVGLAGIRVSPTALTGPPTDVTSLARIIVMYFFPAKLVPKTFGLRDALYNLFGSNYISGVVARAGGGAALGIYYATVGVYDSFSALNWAVRCFFR